MKGRFLQLAFSVGPIFLLTGGLAVGAQSTGYQNLPVVKPVMSCEQLAQADLSKIADAKVALTSATVRNTDKGPYCSLLGEVEPGIRFRADLPTERWTQRYVQNAQGRYADFTGRAGGCAPALNGEIAVATTAGSSIVNPPDSRWGTIPDGRINWAYRANHMTAVAVKGLLRIFYGQPQKFAYMVGCSEGGRQTLVEAQRYPDDFDGVSVGAPVVYDTTHNVGFWHGWEYYTNQRADGSIVLTQPKLAVLHAAVVSRCAPVSGVIDGMLQQPTACKFDKSWVQCPVGAADTANCLTSQEANVAAQLYLGPNDGKGNFFEISGWPAGSELTWRLSSPGKPASNEAFNPNGIHRTYLPPLSGLSTQDIMAQFAFNQEWFDKTVEMAPLMNGANTNLRPFAQRGSKMILWVGAADTIVQPAMPISYYEGVQKALGAKLTDSFLRFFLLPGVGHCGGGEGPNQLDTVSALMAWVEMKQVPQVLVAGRVVPVAAAPGAPGGQNAGGTPPAPIPFASLPRPTEYTRPIYPYPAVARFAGKGDVNDAANYLAVKAAVKTPQVFHLQTMKMLGPDNQKFYRGEKDELVVEVKK